MLYCYAKANQMKRHSFKDDVAITYAKSKEEALKKFSIYYGNVTIKDIKTLSIKGSKEDISILTDY